MKEFPENRAAGSALTYGPKRNHYMVIFENFMRSVLLLILAIILGGWHASIVTTITAHAMGFIALVARPLSKLQLLLFTKIQITPELVVLESGWKRKQRLEVPTSTITTIEFSQSLLQQFANVYRFKLDNASNMAKKNKDALISVVLPYEDIEQIKKILAAVKTEPDRVNLASTGAGRAMSLSPEESTHFVTSRQLVMMGIIGKSVSFMKQGLALLIVFASLGVFRFLTLRFQDIVEESIRLAVLSLLGFAIFLLILGTFSSVVSFYDFRVENRPESIRVQYGRQKKKELNLSKARISGFSYEQPLLMRFLGVGTLKVFAVGFGHDKKDQMENAILHPFLREQELIPYMQQLIPELDVDYPVTPARQGLFRFFLPRKMFLAVLVIAVISPFFFWWMGAHFEWGILLTILLCLLMLADIIMEYRNSGVGGNEKGFTFSTGGYTKVTTFVRTDQIESVTAFTSAAKEKLGIANLKVEFLGYSKDTHLMVRNMDVSVYENLQKQMQ